MKKDGVSLGTVVVVAILAAGVAYVVANYWYGCSNFLEMCFAVKKPF